MDKLKQVFSSHKHKAEDKSSEKSTERLYEKHPQDLHDAYLMGKGDLGAGHSAEAPGLSGAAGAGNVYEADSIPQDTGLSTSGKPQIGETNDRPEGSEAFDTGDPTSAYQGLDATASGATAHREPPIETAAYPLESGRDEFASRDPTSTTGLSTAETGSGLTGTVLADRSVGQYGDSEFASTIGTTTGLGATSGSGDKALIHSGGPHTTFTGNRLDPNFHEDIPSFHEEFIHGSGSHQHHGHDAAIGGAGVANVAAAGAGSYELDQNRSAVETGPASGTIGPHDSNIKNVLDPRVQPDSQKLMAAEQERSTGNDHIGRDAALVGSAGAVGAGALYEAEKHHDDNTTSVFGGTKATDENIHHGRDQFDQDAVVSKRGSVIGETSGGVVAPTSSDHEYGRDAALGGAGAVGAGGLYEAEKHHDENTTSVFGGTKATDENIHHGRDQFDQDAVVPKRGSVIGETSGGVVAPTSSDHEHVRDAALGGSGAVGAGEFYEAEKHHEDRRTSVFGGTKATDENIHHGRDQFDQGATVPQRGSVIGEISGGIVAPTGAGFDSQDPTGVASGVGSTGGHTERMPASRDTTTGTTEKRHGLSSLLHRSHPNKLHKDPPGGSKYANAQTLSDGRVAEPRTGLPMNVEKYGTGTGGTDGNSNIAYDETANPAAWDKVKKLNTPF